MASSRRKATASNFLCSEKSGSTFAGSPNEIWKGKRHFKEHRDMEDPLEDRVYGSHQGKNENSALWKSVLSQMAAFRLQMSNSCLNKAMYCFDSSILTVVCTATSPMPTSPPECTLST